MAQQGQGMLDIQHLRYFVSVVDMGSLSKAAGALSISQPSLSQRVSAMEYQLGVRLHLFESLSGYLVELLCNGRLDMAILFRAAESSGVAIRPLFSEYLSVFGAPRVGAPEGSTCDLSLLSGVPLVLPGPSHGLRLLVERAFTQSNAELNVVADIDSLPVMLSLARNGAVATISSRAVSMVFPQILARRLINPTISRPVWSR